MEAYIGTSGFSYQEWKGSFYPEKLKSTEMLEYYSSKLGSVELNNTFYRLPRRSVLDGWAGKTPETFQFSLKASRRITHIKKLRDAGDLVNYLFRGLDALGPRLGPVLFQLPPTLQEDRDLLRGFLENLQTEVTSLSSSLRPAQIAFEFRHPSWFNEGVYGVLREFDACLVSGDLDNSEKNPPLVATADFAYLRLRRTDYSSTDLDLWARRLNDLGVRRVFAYFKHEELGPQLARDLASRLA